MIVLILIVGGNRKRFDQMSKNWPKVVRFCNNLGQYFNCTTSKGNLDLKSETAVKFWSSDVVL